ncbi:MAG: hypothetical protein AAGG75_14545 [Bacteroidota bacterium]
MMTKAQKIQFIESLYGKIGQAGSSRARQEIINRLVDFVNTWYPNDPIRALAIQKQMDINKIRNDEIEAILSHSVMTQNRNQWTLGLLNLLDTIKSKIENADDSPESPPSISPSPSPIISNDKPILFIATNPINLQLLRESAESKKIEQAKQSATDGQQFQLIKKGEVKKTELSRFVRQNNPYILHFATHADKEKGIILQDHNRRPAYVDSGDLIHILQQQINRGKAIKCLVLNNCNTEGLAQACKDYVDHIIYLNDFIEDEEALRFTEGFYTYLFDEEDFSAAFAEGVYFIKKDENKLRYQILSKAE